MYYVKDIESFGTGLKRITDECDTVGVKVEFQTHSRGFAVVFYRPELSALPDANDTDSSGVQSANSKCKNCTLSERAILEYVEANPTATQALIATAIGKSLRSVKTEMTNLQEMGFLERVGSRRDGRWIVK